MELDGRVALVTGAGSGLGEATARYLHQRGATVVLFDRDAERTPAIAAELGDRAVASVGDATSADDTAAAVAVATELGGLRFVVACAGGGTGSGRLVDRSGVAHDLDLFTSTQRLNVETTFNTLRLAGAAMSALDPFDEDGQRGAMVTTASIAGFEGQIGQIAYGTAKAAVIGMTIIAARDLAAIGVRVNCIAPGTIGTRAWERARPETRAALEAKVPFPRRFGRPEEFARLAEHLLTNDYINGHVARLDGAIRFDPK